MDKSFDKERNESILSGTRVVIQRFKDSKIHIRNRELAASYGKRMLEQQGKKNKVLRMIGKYYCVIHSLKPEIIKAAMFLVRVIVKNGSSSLV